MEYIIYLKSSGEIIGSGSGASIANIQALQDDQQGVLIVSSIPDPKKKYVANDEIVDIEESLLSDIEAREQTEMMRRFRSIRNSLISQTDWTQLGDVSVSNKELWDNYRQALRDLPQTFADITSLDEVTWPEPPES